jgi:hypothetical protein
LNSAPPTRDLIRRIVLDFGFWDGYLERPWETLDDDDPPEHVAELELLTVGDFSLELRVLQNPNLMTLVLRRGDELLLELGYDDDCAQFLPWTLRWTELEHISRLAARRNPELPHPGPLLALLSRFTPLTTDAEVGHARPLLEDALNRLSEGPPVPEPRFGPALPERLAYQLDHWDRRDYRWVDTAEGWALAEDDDAGWGALSLRGPGSEHFPFPHWAAFMDAVVADLARTQARDEIC